MMDTTFDHLLNKRVAIEQPAEGYRVAVDTVLLAAAVPAKVGQKVLDMGCGVGGAMLCLAAYVPGVHLLGIDIQGELIELCRRNIAHNKLDGMAEAIVGDVTRNIGRHPREGGGPICFDGLKEKGMPAFAGMTLENFDHVIMNPPYHEEARHSVSDNAIKRTANAEKTGDLALWIAASAKALNPDGVLTLIHRADRQEDILQEAAKHFGAVDILPIVAREDSVPKRIIMRLHKGAPLKVSICKNFVLYGPNGRYNDGAEAVIRRCKALEFMPL